MCFVVSHLFRGGFPFDGSLQFTLKDPAQEPTLEDGADRTSLRMQ